MMCPSKLFDRHRVNLVLSWEIGTDLTPSVLMGCYSEAA